MAIYTFQGQVPQKRSQSKNRRVETVTIKIILSFKSIFIFIDNVEYYSIKVSLPLHRFEKEFYNISGYGRMEQSIVM